MTDQPPVDPTRMNPQPMEPVLDDLFMAARAARPVPDADLMARILGDAADLTAVTTPAPTPRASMWHRLRRGIADLVPGGMPGVASLTTCALGGVLIGYAGLGDLPLLAGLELIQGQGVVTLDSGVFDEDIYYLSTEDGA